MGQSPDTVLNSSDPGDDTQQRYRYQAVRACCYILALFDDEEEVEEVFCEHHEDVLVKYRTGLFLGVQIKTKTDGSMPLKAGDDEVVKSLRRFIAAEKDYLGHFDGYLLAANCGFWKEAKNGSNLPHLIEEAKGKDLKTAPKCVVTFLKKLCPKPEAVKPKATPKKAKGGETTPPSPASTVPIAPPPPATELHDAQLERGLSVLQKVRLDQTPPLTDMLQPLLDALANCPLVGKDQRYSDLQSIANVLVAEVLEASSKNHASAKKHYFAICRNPQQAVEDSIITAKRFARIRAEEVIRSGFRQCSTPTTESPFTIDRLPQGTRIQQAKMTAGGIVIDDVEEAVQQRQAAEFAVTGWISKYGVPKANGQYQDVRSAVLTECNEAKELAKRADGEYGPDMLQKVKERIRTLYEKEGATLHGLRYDQLLGIAGILTEECPLWWSDRFDLAKEVAS